MALDVAVKKDLGSFKLDVAFSLEGDGVLALLGPSGCGKSLTLGCIAGTVRPDEGRIVLNGRVLFDSASGVNLAPQERHVGYLFQNYALFPTMTVLQNVMCAVPTPGLRGAAARRRRRDAAERQLAAMELGGLEERRPAELSGGQQQRVALARMLASEPALVLLDEPFSALDGHLRWTLEMALADTLKSFSGGTVYVSHDRDEVYRLCDQVCAIDRGVSDPAVPTKRFFEEPGTRSAAVISGCKNISAARAVSAHTVACDDWGVTLTCAEVTGPDTAYVGLRAHYFSTEGNENPIPCAVDRVIDSTFSTIVMLSTQGPGKIRYELDKGAWAALGDPERLTLYIAPEHVMPLADRRGASRVQGGAQ
ncbi:ATP-binding cassette domain-containing protein [Atopobiaceae bacterium 24-176]